MWNRERERDRAKEAFQNSTRNAGSSLFFGCSSTMSTGPVRIYPLPIARRADVVAALN